MIFAAALFLTTIAAAALALHTIAVASSPVDPLDARHTITVPASTWSYGPDAIRHRRGKAPHGAGTAPIAASGCTSEQTEHAASPRLVAHAGSMPAPPVFRDYGGAGLLDPERDTTPHPHTGRRRI